ncbi:MAG TPA: hypothetical protein VGA45_01865, partial [Actinomycetota bacterium]
MVLGAAVELGAAVVLGAAVELGAAVVLGAAVELGAAVVEGAVVLGATVVEVAPGSPLRSLTSALTTLPLASVLTVTGLGMPVSCSHCRLSQE